MIYCFKGKFCETVLNFMGANQIGNEEGKYRKVEDIEALVGRTPQKLEMKKFQAESAKPIASLLSFSPRKIA